MSFIKHKLVPIFILFLLSPSQSLSQNEDLKEVIGGSNKFYGEDSTLNPISFGGVDNYHRSDSLILIFDEINRKLGYDELVYLDGKFNAYSDEVYYPKFNVNTGEFERYIIHPRFHVRGLWDYVFNATRVSILELETYGLLIRNNRD